ILTAEGLNGYRATDISTLTPAVLQTYDVVILGEIALSASQVAMLTDWVNAGGNLVAMRPDPQLAGLLGLSAAGSPLSDAYLQVDASVAPGKGIVAQTIQYHGAADRYLASGATTVATIFSDAVTPTANPAVTLRSVGNGHAAAFVYDLARSRLYTHPDTPARAATERER